MRKIGEIKKEYECILKELSNPELASDWEKFEQIQKRKNFLEKIIEKEEEIQKIKIEIAENETILSAREDEELITLAENEIVQLKEKIKILEKELESLLKTEEGQERNNTKITQAVIMEIRAGVGGEEANLFVADLFKMYSKYAQQQNWKQKILNSNPTELGGFKEIIFELANGDVFSKMQYEAGVHRVQRIPVTEKSGRIHTSTASVAVLPKPKKTEIKINPQDLKIDFYRSSGKGGQNVNKRETAVRITHLPSGIVVTSQTERNQLQNRENAMAILEARLLEKKELTELTKLDKERKAQIGGAKRAEKIRTYNFPQNRLTDHRLKKSWHNLEQIMEGKLDSVILSFTEN